MDVKSYCDTVDAEIAGVKAKLEAIRQKAAEGAKTGQADLEPMVQEIDGLVADLDRHVERLANECPAEWQAEREQIDGKLSQVNDKWKEVWGVLGESEYGLGGA